MHSGHRSENSSQALNSGELSSRHLRDHGKFLTFKLATQRFGIDINYVKELIEYTAATHIPLTPAQIHGVINLRGSVVPVIDLASRIGKKPCEIGKKTCIVISELTYDNNSMEIGFLVDEVDQVINIPDESIEPTPQFGIDIDYEFIWGMGTLESSFIVLLDLEIVLSVEELSNLIRQFT
jgi:purine-binding chemotaxis protein CheW